MNSVKDYLQNSLIFSGLLVNSAYVIHEEMYFSVEKMCPSDVYFYLPREPGN